VPPLFKVHTRILAHVDTTASVDSVQTDLPDNSEIESWQIDDEVLMMLCSLQLVTMTLSVEWRPE
jgi:hypothetical protein